MGTLIDYIALWVIRATIWLLNCIPMRLRLWLIRSLIRLVASLVPSFKKVSLINLALAFPDKDAAWHRDIYEKSFDNLARIFVDFARMHKLTPEWIREHVACPFIPDFERLKGASKEGVLIATGHLGSFELMAHSIGMLGHPISFVVRNFSMFKLDSWWTKNREQSGNIVIPRQGAVKEVFKQLQEGRDVALLFDQNVKRNHAVFVPWFGKPAATTMTIGIVAVRLRSRVVVCSMKYHGDDKYEIDARECNCDDIYDNDSLNQDEKVSHVIGRTSAVFEEMIRNSPESWFWMHRRWKTRPEGEKEDIY